MPDEPKQSLHGRFLDAVAARIRSLALEGISEDAIVVRKFPWNRNLLRAGIQLGIFVTLGNKVRNNVSFGGLAATNESDVVGYGAQITFLKASNQDLAIDDQWLLWREQVENAFTPTTEQPLADVPEIATLLIETGPVLDPAAFVAQYDAQAFMVRGVTRERRGQAA
jgi:hypothetical protein